MRERPVIAVRRGKRPKKREAKESAKSKTPRAAKPEGFYLREEYMVPKSYGRPPLCRAGAKGDAGRSLFSALAAKSWSFKTLASVVPSKITESGSPFYSLYGAGFRVTAFGI